ncbi:MAG TPA: hypothetical protein VM051_09810 [Usitatibacter sp.]|nr:hypothetical protein [Usitatibacter sp.]
MTPFKSLPGICALLLAGGAQAGVFGTMSGSPAPPNAERKYDAATLKRVDLKSCVVDAYSIDTADALFEMQRPKVEEERAELQKLREASRGKPTSESAAAETQLRAKAQMFNAKVAALNSQVAYAQETRERFSRLCKGRRYYFDDLSELRGELPAEIAAILPAK